MYKEDLALNKLQWLICYKIKPNQTKHFQQFFYKKLIFISTKDARILLFLQQNYTIKMGIIRPLLSHPVAQKLSNYKSNKIWAYLFLDIYIYILLVKEN